MKKILLGLGTLITTISPFVVVISCSSAPAELDEQSNEQVNYKLEASKVKAISHLTKSEKKVDGCALDKYAAIVKARAKAIKDIGAAINEDDLALAASAGNKLIEAANEAYIKALATIPTLAKLKLSAINNLIKPAKEDGKFASDKYKAISRAVKEATNNILKAVDIDEITPIQLSGNLAIEEANETYISCVKMEKLALKSEKRHSINSLTKPTTKIGNYAPSEYALIHTVINKAIDDINAAKNIADVTSIFSKSEIAIKAANDAYEKAVATMLPLTKIKAIKKLVEPVKKDDNYPGDKYQAILDAIKVATDKINEAKNDDEITKAIATGNIKIKAANDAYEKAVAIMLPSNKAKAISKLVKPVKKDGNYAADKYKVIGVAVETAKDNINKAKDEDGITWAIEIGNIDIDYANNDYMISVVKEKITIALAIKEALTKLVKPVEQDDEFDSVYAPQLYLEILESIATVKSGIASATSINGIDKWLGEGNKQITLKNQIYEAKRAKYLESGMHFITTAALKDWINMSNGFLQGAIIELPDNDNTIDFSASGDFGHQIDVSNVTFKNMNVSNIVVKLGIPYSSQHADVPFHDTRFINVTGLQSLIDNVIVRPPTPFISYNDLDEFIRIHGNGSQRAFENAKFSYIDEPLDFTGAWFDEAEFSNMDMSRVKIGGSIYLQTFAKCHFLSVTNLILPKPSPDLSEFVISN